jgi:hypothetical protein
VGSRAQEVREAGALLGAEGGVDAGDRLGDAGAELGGPGEADVEGGGDAPGVEARGDEEVRELAAERPGVLAERAEDAGEGVRLRQDGALLVGGRADAPEDAARTEAAVVREAPPRGAAGDGGGEEDGEGAEGA